MVILSGDLSGKKNTYIYDYEIWNMIGISVVVEWYPLVNIQKTMEHHHV